MTRTPEREPDETRPRRWLRWPRSLAGWLGRLRPHPRVLPFAARIPAPGRRRLLFLDDDPNRAARFLKEHPRAVWVTTVPDCLARLAEPWDEVHLDHDLGGKTFVDSSQTDCGMEIIRWLCKEPRPHLKRTRFFVHTHNAAAGLLMVLLVQGSGYTAEFRPFGLDLEKLLAHNETHTGSGAETGPHPAQGPIRWLRLLKAGATRVTAEVRLGIARARGLSSNPAHMEAGRGPRPAVPREIDAAESGPPASRDEAVGRIDPQPLIPGSAPVIQPPPRTRSS